MYNLIPYNPHNHFWLRGNGTVYSSLAQADLPVDDAAYLLWVETGGRASSYPCDEAGRESPKELAAVLAPYGLRAYPPALEEGREEALLAIGRARDARLEEGGLIWNGYLVSIDKEATDRMTSTAVQFMAGALESVVWKMSDGEYAKLDREDFFAMSTATGAAVQECYAVEQAKRAEVLALADEVAIQKWLANPLSLRTGWPVDEG